MSGAGSADLQRYRQGRRLTRGAAIRAKCAACCGDYADGRQDCGVPGCPLYPFMPYVAEIPCTGHPAAKSGYSVRGARGRVGGDR